ncbi:MAG: Abi family protein, partial [Muribaculaceae bacterium]|nr:Abi family protein [Muribaculaceae bacterium]
FTLLPMIPRKMSKGWINLSTDPLRIYFNLCIVKYFINIISPNNQMTLRLKELLSDYPEIDTKAMGFPNGWEEEPLWRKY